MINQGIIQSYKSYLPVTEQTPALSLHEGNTPLVFLSHFSERFDIELHAKIEGANPTGSFKDRGMVMAVAKAKEAGSKTVVCASTGNTSASAAAYAAKADMQAIIVIPKGKVALGKLAQAVMYGAKIVEIDGNFDDALHIVKEMSESMPVTLVNSVNPYRLEGQKTAAFEICEQLGSAPDVLAIPVGNAGNISAYWKGFKEFALHRQVELPKMYGFEAKGAAAITQDRVIATPETVATAIRIGNPASWNLAVAAREESGGLIGAVTDEEILHAFRLLPRLEGLFAEPGSCASIAGVLQQCEAGNIAPGSKVVAILTGNGLKDPQTALDHVEVQPVTLPNDARVVRDYFQKEVEV